MDQPVMTTADVRDGTMTPDEEAFARVLAPWCMNTTAIEEPDDREHQSCSPISTETARRTVSLYQLGMKLLRRAIGGEA